MGMTAFYVDDRDPAIVEAESLACIDKALELGCNFFDTAWVYKNATSHNETLVGKAIAKHGREKFIIATKFGIDFSNPANPFAATEADIRRQLGESLERLGTNYVDLYYQHRQSPTDPIEDVARTLKALVAEGKIKFIGFSEVSASEIRRAHAIHPVTAVQLEYSLSERGIEKDIIPTCRELGIAIVAYSPLGRGLLSATFATRDSLAASDWRLTNPRFSDENFEKNKAVVEKVKELAGKRGLTPGQLALAWLHNKGADIFPIPGTKSAARLAENLRAATVVFTADEMSEIEAAVPELVGGRYAPGMMGACWEGRAENL